ncbi:hypothetical protein [Leptospira fletcheri]|uniref:hypothetical protein n=1 Tax=Leptospira fletcheri TaxID=2484981 RepID=UPI001FE529B9|nr:hypothetical protein [Leptospira fletcheri]
MMKMKMRPSSTSFDASERQSSYAWLVFALCLVFVENCFLNPIFKPLVFPAENSNPDFTALIGGLLGNANQKAPVASAGGATAAPVLDTTPPVPGGSGIISAVPSGTYSGSTKAQVTLSWTAGTDNVTSQANLTYQVYYSLSNNLTTLTNTLANGTPFSTTQAGLSEIAVNQLFAKTAYYFNVVLTDQAGNQSIYTSQPSTMMPAVYIFDSVSNNQGNIGTRTNADTLCANRISSISQTSYPWKNSCSIVNAFISLSPADTVSNILKSVNAGVIVLGSQGMILASDKVQLTSGTIQNTIRNALPEYSSGAGWWSFSDFTGQFVSVDSCANATSNSGGVSGRIGFPDITSSAWIDDAINGEGSPSGATCDIFRTVFCICY